MTRRDFLVVSLGLGLYVAASFASRGIVASRGADAAVVLDTVNPPVCGPTTTAGLRRVLPTAELQGCGEARYGGVDVYACYWRTSRAEGDCHAITYSDDGCVTWHAACRCAVKTDDCALDGTDT